MLDSLFAFLTHLPSGAIYALAFAVLLVCGLGVPIPEDITLFVLGYFSYLQTVDLTTSIVLALLGVLLGDSLTFLVGRNFGDNMLKWRGVRHVFSPTRIETVRGSFRKYGNVFIFVARFAVGLRAPTFWVAGHFGVPYLTFIIFDGLAALISVPALIYLAYHFGGMIDELRKYQSYIGIGAALLILALVARSVYQSRRAARPSPSDPGV